MSAECTSVPLFTAVTDIRWFLVLWAEFFLEIFTDPEAVCTALSTVLGPPVTADSADIPIVLAGITEQAGIKPAAAILNDEMIPYFLRNGRRIFPYECTYL